MQEYLPIHRFKAGFLACLALYSLVSGVYGYNVIIIPAILFSLACDTPLAASWTKTNVVDPRSIKEILPFTVLPAVLLGLSVLAGGVDSFLLLFFLGMWVIDDLSANIKNLAQDDARLAWVKDGNVVPSRCQNFYEVMSKVAKCGWTPALALLCFTIAKTLPIFSLLFITLFIIVSYFEIRDVSENVASLPNGWNTTLPDVVARAVTVLAQEKKDLADPKR